MTKRTFPSPLSGEVNTYYEKPFDRLTGKYTVQWQVDGHRYRHQVRNRFTDFEGHWPSFRNLLYIPEVIRTRIEGKKRFILNNPVPFLAFDAIAHLDKIVKKGMRVLEIGGGNSTLWFLKRNINLTTIEHSSEWGKAVLTHIDNDREITPESLSGFKMEIVQGVSAIEHIKKYPERHFDLVLVDCANQYISRNECVKACLDKIKINGWLALDDSDHPVNWQGVDMMERYERIQYTGYAPMKLNVAQTSFWKIKY